MSKNDSDVIVCKLLAYLMACLKAGIEANVEKAKELTGCNNIYWNAIIEDLSEKGYIKLEGIKASGGDYAAICSMRITIDGAQYLKENEAMTKVKRTLGSALSGAIDAAIAVTQLI